MKKYGRHHLKGKTRAQKQDKLRGNQDRIRMDVLPNEERTSSKTGGGPRPRCGEPLELASQKRKRQRPARGTGRGRRNKPGFSAGQRNQGKNTVGMRSWTVVSKAAHGRKRLEQRLLVSQ